MNNATAWYELGVKQQENEREHKAVQALQRAVELDPSHLPSWLALAISHTNAGNRQGTYDAVYEWVSHNEKHQEAVKRFHSQGSENNHVSLAERYSQLIQCLITMARSDITGDIDADIQVALAVLLNTNEVCSKSRYAFYMVLTKDERNTKRPKIALKRRWPSGQRCGCPFISGMQSYFTPRIGYSTTEWELQWLIADEQKRHWITITAPLNSTQVIFERGESRLAQQPSIPI